MSFPFDSRVLTAQLRRASAAGFDATIPVRSALRGAALLEGRGVLSPDIADGPGGRGEFAVSGIPFGGADAENGPLLDDYNYQRACY